MFKRILVAVDGSPASNAGLRSAVSLAADQRASLVVVHVVDLTLPVGPESAFYVPSYIDAYEAALVKGGGKLLDKAVAQARALGVRVEAVLARSRASTVARAVLVEARRAKVDVIVLGTHGRRGLRRVVMGSDAEEILRQASVPVLLVRGGRGVRKPSLPSRRRVRAT
jgi:nucleotide-binding universal stress UspA family protein